MPEELLEQVPVMKEVLHAMEIPTVELAGYEADDIIRLYYDFIVLKSQKNLGFSIKKLREKMGVLF